MLDPSLHAQAIGAIRELRSPLPSSQKGVEILKKLGPMTLQFQEERRAGKRGIPLPAQNSHFGISSVFSFFLRLATLFAKLTFPGLPVRHSLPLLCFCKRGPLLPSFSPISDSKTKQESSKKKTVVFLEAFFG